MERASPVGSVYPCIRAVATTPLEDVSVTVSFLMSSVTFTWCAKAQLPKCRFEATCAFTFVTARILAHHPVDGFVNSLQYFGFPTYCYSRYRASDFYPDGTFTHWILLPYLDVHTPRRCATLLSVSEKHVVR